MHGEMGETGQAVGNVCCVHRAVKGGELSHQKTDPARRPGTGRPGTGVAGGTGHFPEREDLEGEA